MVINEFKNFVYLNIFVLLGINSLVLIMIYYWTIKEGIEEKIKDKTKKHISCILNKYLNGQAELNEVKSHIKGKYKKIIAIDVLIENIEKDEKEFTKSVDRLELDLFLIKLIKKSVSLNYLRKLAFLKSKVSYEVFLECSLTTNIDIQFICYYGLSLLNVDLNKKHKTIHQLLKSDLYVDRKVEILNNMDLSVMEWIDVLESEEGELEKSVILKIIADYEGIIEEEYYDKIIKYIYDKKEVKIAAISALCKSKNEKYLYKLFELYQNEELWEVRAAVAKGISYYKLNLIKDMLLKMIRDKEWWVRFNAARTISLMGEEGVYILIDLSIDKSDENAAALAYYFLNSNKDIYETINRLEV